MHVSLCGFCQHKVLLFRTPEQMIIRQKLPTSPPLPFPLLTPCKVSYTVFLLPFTLLGGEALSLDPIKVRTQTPQPRINILSSNLSCSSTLWTAFNQNKNTFSVAFNSDSLSIQLFTEGAHRSSIIARNKLLFKPTPVYKF